MLFLSPAAVREHVNHVAKKPIVRLHADHTLLLSKAGKVHKNTDSKRELESETELEVALCVSFFPFTVHVYVRPTYLKEY